MRFKFAVPVLLAACLISAVAIAANDKVETSFQSLSASGVTGDAVLKPVPAGGTLIHVSLRGLEPNAIYTSKTYETNQECGVGTPSVMIEQFQANPAGVAQWNRKVDQELISIQSISVELVSDGSLKACAPVTQ
jgi:hypothetical protein